MITAYNPTTEEILTWDIPGDGILKKWLPYKCKAACCDIDCECADEDPACTHSTHPIYGQCVVKVTVSETDTPIYECLGHIPRGIGASDCAHESAADCTCGRIEKYQAEIALKHGPVRRAGGQQAKEQAKHADMVREGLRKRGK